MEQRAWIPLALVANDGQPEFVALRRVRKSGCVLYPRTLIRFLDPLERLGPCTTHAKPLPSEKNVARTKYPVSTGWNTNIISFSSEGYQWGTNSAPVR